MMGYFFGNIYTDSKKTAHELNIIKAGRDHKWWTSARILLGLSENQAQSIHQKMNNPISFRSQGSQMDNVTSGDNGGAVDPWSVPVDPSADDISYVDSLLE